MSRTAAPVRGLLIPSDWFTPLAAVEFDPDDQGYLPGLRQHVGDPILPVTVLTTLDFVVGARNQGEAINQRAHLIRRMVIRSAADGEHEISQTDQTRAQGMVGTSNFQPPLAGPVVMLGVDLRTGNYASAPAELIDQLIRGEETAQQHPRAHAAAASSSVTPAMLSGATR